MTARVEVLEGSVAPCLQREADRGELRHRQAIVADVQPEMLCGEPCQNLQGGWFEIHLARKHGAFSGMDQERS
jgi:hypothetical protein